MKSELLLLRLEVLKRGVEDVQEVLKAGKAAPAAINKARENVDSAWWFVNRILRVAEDPKVIDALEKLPTSAGSEWKNELKDIADGLEKVREEGPGLKHDLEAAKEGLRKLDSRAVQFGKDFGKRMGKQTEQLGTKIAELTTDVREQPASAKLWQQYFDRIQPDATRLFIEYLDLLGGVSIRERGLAIKALADVCHLDELCALAEWHFTYELTLIQDWDGPAFVALPGRDLVSDISTWPILRLGFASWSIWGLPLEGHEFGKLLADARMSDRSERQKKYWKPYITEFGERGTRALIADSIATWAEGPAYACALLFLVLNPSRLQSGHSVRNVCDADRAEVVLTSLRGRATTGTGGGQRSAGGYDYLPFIDALEKQWKDACHFTSVALPADRMRLLQDLPDVVRLQLGLQKAFDLKDWNLADKVLECLNHDQDVPVDLAAGVRHLTNAAWRGRFRTADGVGRDEEGNAHASPAELELRAMKAGIALITPRDTKQPGGDASSLKNPGR
jgi:hypothetical protein